MKKLAQVAVLGLGLALAGCKGDKIEQHVEPKVEQQVDTKKLSFIALSPNTLSKQDKKVLDMLSTEEEIFTNKDSKYVKLLNVLKVICAQADCSYEEMKKHSSKSIFVSISGNDDKHFHEPEIKELTTGITNRINKAMIDHGRDLRVVENNTEMFSKHFEQMNNKYDPKCGPCEKAQKEKSEKLLRSSYQELKESVK